MTPRVEIVRPDSYGRCVIPLPLSPQMGYAGSVPIFPSVSVGLLSTVLSCSPMCVPVGLVLRRVHVPIQ